MSTRNLYSLAKIEEDSFGNLVSATDWMTLFHSSVTNGAMRNTLKSKIQGIAPPKSDNFKPLALLYIYHDDYPP